MKNSIKQIKTKIKKFVKPILLFIRQINSHSISAHAAQSTLFIFISFFPFVMMLLSLLSYIPLPISGTDSFSTNLFPSSMEEYIHSLLGEIHELSNGTIISVTAITALWAASKGMYAIGNGLNAVYEVKETRNYFILRLFALLETVLFIIIIAVVLIFLVFGNLLSSIIKEASPLISNLIDIIINLRGIGGLIILSLFFTAIYVYMPDRKAKFKSQFPGGFLTATGWIIFSNLFSFYVDNFSNYSNIYGSLAAVVVFLLWLYFCMYILFLGGEINSDINKKCESNNHQSDKITSSHIS